MLLQRVRVDPAQEGLSDVRVEGDRVTEISAPGERLSAAGDDVVDGAGGVLLPGFVDAHVHMAQWSMARRRIDVGHATSAADVVDILVGSGERSVVRAQGYRAALWSTPPHKDMLEAALPGAHVAVTSMDLHSVWLSPALMDALGVVHPTGVFRDHDAIAMMGALDARVDDAELDRHVLDGADELARRGITEILDFEYDDNWSVWSRRAARRLPGVRVTASTWPTWLEQCVAAGRRTGEPVPDTAGTVRMGPLKIMADGSLNTRTACCHDPYPDDGGGSSESHGLLLVDEPELTRLMTTAASGSIASAVHAIGDRANTVVLDAVASVRTRMRTGELPTVGARIEHAQQVRPADLVRFADLGVVASVQPQHAMSDRDVVDVLWADRASRAYPYRSLHRLGVTLQFGSDAPVSPPDPRAAVADAVHRTDDDRPPWEPDEALPLSAALRSACGGRDAVTVGSAADLTVLAQWPHLLSNTDLRSVPVLVTISGGRLTHLSA